jgi:hypothetical protein
METLPNTIRSPDNKEHEAVFLTTWNADNTPNRNTDNVFAQVSEQYAQEQNMEVFEKITEQVCVGVTGSEYMIYETRTVAVIVYANDWEVIS